MGSSDAVAFLEGDATCCWPCATPAGCRWRSILDGSARGRARVFDADGGFTTPS